MTITKSALTACPKHNDPLKVYCETCRQVICRDCTISKEHKTHNFELISECYPKHRQQIEASLDQVKHKMADLNTAVTHLDTTDRKVIEKGEQLQEQINTHAQQIIDQVQRSRQHLSQQLHNIVKQKTQLLAAQRQQAQRLHTQLNTCHEMIEHSLKEWTEQQILTEKHTMINEMNTATQHVDPTVFQPIENNEIKFTKKDTIEKEIGLITSTTYGKATLEVLPCLAKRQSIATLTLQSQDGSPFSLPPSLISSTLSSPGNTHSDITQTRQAGKYNITFTPSTLQDQLIVQVGGVDIPDSPFTLPTPEMRGKPVNTITGLNRPHGIAVSNNGDIVVAEWGAHCITTLNKAGKKVRSFGTKGAKEGQFIYPHGVAITNDGHILVTDNFRLQKLTTDGVCVKSVGSSESGSGRLQFNTPAGIAVHPTTRQIFVADGGNNRIQVFNNDLTFSRTIAPTGNKSFNIPFDVALDIEGYLYVAEYWSHCITKLTTKGQYITRFCSYGSAPGQLHCPSSLTINNNLVYVTEEDNNRVSIFDTNGTFIHCFGKEGSEEGEFTVPHGITTDTFGNLYVGDTYNNRIVVYSTRPLFLNLFTNRGIIVPRPRTACGRDTVVIVLVSLFVCLFVCLFVS